MQISDKTKGELYCGDYEIEQIEDDMPINIQTSITNHTIAQQKQRNKIDNHQRIVPRSTINANSTLKQRNAKIINLKVKKQHTG